MLQMLKNICIVIAMMFLVFAGYVVITNRNAENMTVRQKILKTLYPVVLWFNKATNKNRDVLLHAPVQPSVSLYSLQFVLNDGSVLHLASLKGKKLLLVNTASACGYTAQYGQLQTLYNQYNGQLVIIGFPSNDFKEQEQGTDKEIASFCKKNFGVTFPLAQKTVVIKNPNQNTIFQWLTDPAQNGWNSQPPTWNFSKYLINENGALTGFFGPGIEPTGKEIMQAIQ